MKDIRFRNKMISLSIAVALFIGCCPTAFAANSSDAMPEADAVDIDENVAMVIAAKHVVENFEGTKWNENTRFNEIIPFYSTDENVNAYCITLRTDDEDSGYVIVSADIEQPLILEYSDAATLYIEDYSTASKEVTTAKVKSTGDHVYFYGPLSYSTEKRSEKEQVEKREANLMEADAIADETDQSSIYNIEAARNLVTRINDELQENSIVSPMSGDGTLPISNPIEYIKYWYSGYQYKNYDYKNLDQNDPLLWIEPYIIHPDDKNACVLYATAAIIHYWRPKWNYSGILNQCKSIYKDYWPASPDYEVQLGYHWRFVRAVLDSYGLTSWDTGASYAPWTKGKSEISAGNPCILCIARGGGYKNHAVTAFAWTTFRVYSSTESLYLNFFKIQDGYNDRDKNGNKIDKSSSRYVCANFHFNEDDVIGRTFVVYVS